MALIRTWTSLNPGMRWPKGMFVWNWPSGNDGVFYIFSAFCSYRYMYLCYPWNERPFNEPSHLTNIVYKTLYTLTLLWHLIIMTHPTFKSHILSPDGWYEHILTNCKLSLNLISEHDYIFLAHWLFQLH